MLGEKGCTDRRTTNRTHLYVEEAAGSTALRFKHFGSRGRILRWVWGLPLALIEHDHNRVDFLAGIVKKDSQVTAVVCKNTSLASIGDNKGFKIGFLK